RLLEDPSSRPLVEWAETGDRFTVLDTAAEFSRQVLPLYFKHNNFQSFVRQLNMYGFHKGSFFVRAAGASTDVWEFSHPNFRRGLPEEMLLIKRK
ncbi:winged helix DNA-binding domain-containing protein, partial [Gonapodya prolifera JEL478]